MTTTELPKRRIVIEFGQSNASPIGDIKTWEDKHPNLAVRSSMVNTAYIPKFGGGAYSEHFTLQGSFPGGPTVDQLGRQVVGEWQTANLAGVAVEPVRILTFYNPSAHFGTYDVVASHYPGFCTINLLEEPTPSRFLTNLFHQQSQPYDTVQSYAGDTLTLTATPVLQEGDLVAFKTTGVLPNGLDERQVYRIKAGSLSGNTYSVEEWPEAVDNPAGATVDITAGSGTLTVHRSSIGTVTRKKTQTQHTAAMGSPGDLAAGKLWMSVYPPFLPPPEDNEVIQYEVSLADASSGQVTRQGSVYAHTTTGPMLFKTRFGGLHDAGTNGGVFPTSNVTAAAISQLKSNNQALTYREPLKFLSPKLPVREGDIVRFLDTVLNAVTNNGSAGTQLTTYDAAGTSSSPGPDVGDVVAPKTNTVTGQKPPAPAYYTFAPSDVNLVNGEITLGSHSIPVGAHLRFETSAADLPAGLTEGTTYVVVATTATAIQVGLELGGGVIIPTDQGSGTHNVIAKRLWVVNKTSTYLELAWTKGGSPISFAATLAYPLGLFTLNTIPPDGVSFDGTHYVTRVQREFEPAEPRELDMATSSDGKTLTYGLKHELTEDEEVVVKSGDTALPVELRDGARYYVRLVNNQHIQLSATRGGPAITYTYTAGEVVRIRAVGDLIAFYLSDSPGGPVLRATRSGEDSYSLSMVRLERFSGSLTGLQARCVSGANVGSSVMLTHVEFDTENGQNCAFVHHDDAWPNVPTDDDVFVIEPPPLNGEQVPFHKWAKWLPWSPIEGNARGLATPTSTNMPIDFAQANSQGEVGTAVSSSAAKGEAIKLYTDGKQLPNRLEIGRSYFVTVQAGGAVYFSESYDGPHFTAPYRAVAAKSGNQLTIYDHQLAEDEGVLFRINDGYDDTNKPAEITAGTRYYAHVVDKDTIELRTEPGGSSMSLSDPTSSLQISQFYAGDSDAVYVDWCKHEARSNPYPPGFSYPNQHSLLTRYQPFPGPMAQGAGGVSAGVSLALHLHRFFGEPVYLINVAFGGTSLAHKEVVPGFSSDYPDGLTLIQPYAWVDLLQQISWAPDDQNGCFARLLDVLDAAKLACDEEGVQGVVELLYWNQGEEDQVWEDFANRYGENLRTFKAKVRAAIEERGLCIGSGDRIPFIQPIPLRDYGSYPSTVEAQIKAEHEDDLFARWVESGTELDSKNENNPYDDDDIHLAGSSFDTLADWVFDAWLDVRYEGAVDVEICNLALSHVGEKPVVQSIDPPDDSVQAQTCAQFYQLAYETILEEHLWDFARRRITLVQRDSSDRGDWAYAYDYPKNIAGTPLLIPTNVTDDAVWLDGQPAGIPHDTSLDVNGKRGIYCNESGVDAIVNARVNDTRKFSATFKRAVSYELASLIAGPFIKGEPGAQAALQFAKLARYWGEKAKTHDSQNTRDRSEVQRDFIPNHLRDR